MLACLLLLRNREGSEDWNHVRNNYGSRQGHAWRHQLRLEQLEELPALEEAVGEAGMLVLLPQGAAEEASAQQQDERSCFLGLCRGPGGWTPPGSAPQLRGQSLLEALAAGCAFFLRRHWGLWRCNLVNLAQGTEDLVLCPSMLPVMGSLLLLAKGNGLFMVQGFRI